MGSGDGLGPYRWARAQPDRLFVAVDANAEALLGTAKRAAKKPARGGVSNLVCVAATPEELAAEAPAIASMVTVILPWGSLLRGVALPDTKVLAAISSLCRAEASVDVVMSLDARDRGAAMPPLTLEHVHALPEAYARSGLRITRIDALGATELRALGTRWAARLAFGRPRTVWRLRARPMNR